MKIEYLSSNVELMYGTNNSCFLGPEKQVLLFGPRDLSWFKEEQHRSALKNKAYLVAKLQDPNIDFVVADHQAMFPGGSY